LRLPRQQPIGRWEARDWVLISTKTVVISSKAALKDIFLKRAQAALPSVD
jgi:hypothetical protein